MTLKLIRAIKFKENRYQLYRRVDEEIKKDG